MLFLRPILLQSHYAFVAGISCKLWSVATISKNIPEVNCIYLSFAYATDPVTSLALQFMEIERNRWENRRD